jgi:hypothetical protein
MVKPLLAVVRSMGLQVHAYLDDILIVGKSTGQVKVALNHLVHVFLQAGFILNVKKSDPIPSQDLVYLGARFLTKQGTVNLPPARKEALLVVLKEFGKVGRYLPALKFLRLLGVLTATIEVVKFGRFHMRPIQFYLKQRWNARMGFMYPILVTNKLPPLLAWWQNTNNLERGVPLKQGSPQWILTTDASEGGWGGHVAPVGSPSNATLTQGIWSGEESHLHINLLEIRAVFLSLQHFQDFLEGKVIKVESDNTSVVAHLNKQGGVKSWAL